MDEYYRAVRALPAWLARPLSALPPGIAEQVHEIRLRVGCGVQLTIGGKPCCPAELPALQKLRLTPLQMEEIFVPLCGGSVHSHETEIAVGYVTLSCGCRAALAGQFYCAPGQSAVLQELRSVNIRVARNREFPLPQKLRDILQQRFSGMLLRGEPDSGKTTLLRGVARELAKQNRAVAVIDERREIFPSEESAALSLDILSGIPKGQAVQMALRTLSPQIILLDELGGMDELYALEQGLFSGVEFIATLHAASWEEAARRPQVQYLQKCGALHAAVLLKGRTAPGQLKEVRFSGRRCGSSGRCSGWAAAGAREMQPAGTPGGIWRRWKRRSCSCSGSGRRSITAAPTSPCCSAGWNGRGLSGARAFRLFARRPG